MNIIYPFNLLEENIFPILNNQVNGLPVYIDLSKENNNVDKICNSQTQKEFNNYMFNELKQSRKSWAVSGYLEDRTTLLKKYPQMVTENRVYHLGVDITAPVSSSLFSPLDSKVVLSEYEEGDGNYGGMIVLRHSVGGLIFYTLYGHLNRSELPKVGQIIKKGEKFAKIGDFFENGNWFYHIHLQVLTEKGYTDGWIHKGYCSGKDLINIDKYCPNPIFMLKSYLL
ncbi:MAG TPA: peptidoglycan DD-metalloendopeptidase family protein [Rickettsiales bacterium]|nr:peptidoglycan DD-metalloendopeptidase family protein [Rickettsiales bacterium]